MQDGRLPKHMLFGEQKKKQSYHGVKKRWRDQESKDVEVIGLKRDWYQLCQEGKGRFRKCHEE